MARSSDPQLARQWRDRLLRFERCPHTVSEFCQLEGYSAASFYAWRRKLAEDQPGELAATFVPVDFPEAGTAIESSSPVRIELPGGAVVKFESNVSDDAQCRAIRNIVKSLTEVTA